jgi:integrase
MQTGCRARPNNIDTSSAWPLQSAHAFGCWFIRRCREAGLARSAHGWRKLGAQRCAEAGASEHQLMALFGWANPKQAAVYTKKANRAKLEAAAAPLLDAPSSNAAGADGNAAAERDSNKSVPLFAGVPAGGTFRPKKS